MGSFFSNVLEYIAADILMSDSVSVKGLHNGYCGENKASMMREIGRAHV